MYVCLFIPYPVGPMIQHNLQEKYMHSSQVAHRQCLLTISVLRGTSSKSVSMQASQISSQEVRTRSMIEVRRLNVNKPHGDATTTRQTTHGPRQTMCRSHSPPTSRRATLPRKERQNFGPYPTGHTRVTQCNSKCPA